MKSERRKCVLNGRFWSAQARGWPDIEEFGNLQIEAVLPPETALQLLERLERDFFSRFAMIAFSTDIEVIRSAKF